MLIIDTPALAKLFGEIFEALGWAVVICNNHACAMSRVAGSEPYDVILLSYDMRGTTGVQITRLIRSLEHRIMTAVVMPTSSEERMDEAKAAGVDEVLNNPVNISSLILAVSKHVG